MIMAGPSPEPEREPTPGEWVEWFLQLPRDRQLNIAAIVIRAARDSYNCFAMNHQSRIEDLTFALAQRDKEFDQLARYGSVVSD